MTRKWGRMATYPKLDNSQFSLHKERPHGDTPHSIRVCVPRSQRFFTWCLPNAVSHCSNSSLSLNLFSICAELVAKVEAGKSEDKNHARERVTKGRQERARVSKVHNLCLQSARSQRFFTSFLPNAVSHCSNSSLSLNLFSICAELVAKVKVKTKITRAKE